MATVKKAIRVQIYLGDIPLYVYQLPDGTYNLAGRNVTDAIDSPKNSLSQKLKVKSLKELPHANPNLSQIQANTGEKLIPVSIEDAVAYWGIMANKGNQKATDILVACAIEAIERRADKALGKQRTEEERNARMKARIEGKQTRLSLTDAIEWYKDNFGYLLTENEAKFLYVHVSNTINMALFARSAKKIKKDWGLTKECLIRDYLDSHELLLCQSAEDLVCRMIYRTINSNGEPKPKELAKEVGDRLAIDPILR
jgi:hypothetical protein